MEGYSEIRQNMFSLRANPARRQLFQVDQSCHGEAKKATFNKGTPTPGPCNSQSYKRKRGRPRKRDETPSKGAVDGVMKYSKRDHDKVCGVRSSAKTQGRWRPKQKSDVTPAKTRDLEEEKIFRCKDMGHLVWSKFGREGWWPGIVVPGAMAGMKETKPNHSWLFWFCDHKVSQVDSKRLDPFVSSYDLHQSNTAKGFNRAVGEALSVLEERCGVDTERDLGITLREWAEEGFYLPDDVTWQQTQRLHTPDTANPLPEFVVKKLDKIRQVYEDSESDDENYVLARNSNALKDSAVEQVMQGRRQLEDICLACDDADKRPICPHPLFVGGLCSQCKENIMQTLLSCGEDGISCSCTLCGGGGRLYVCDNKACRRTFCYDCLDTYLDDNTIHEIKMADTWSCFLCREYSKRSHGYLHPKAGWRSNVLGLYNTESCVQIPNLSKFRIKRPIRVLSLFDGIGTGKLILDQLGFDVDIYYACETNEDAVHITEKNHDGKIIQLGDVRGLTFHKIDKLGRIDLLIGACPTNDFTNFGGQKHGFDGTGTLFYEFTRILWRLQQHAMATDSHLFWMFEHVASMTAEHKKIMSKYLKCEPAVWDASFFTPQSRARYLWGNIPDIYSSRPCSSNFFMKTERKKLEGERQLKRCNEQMAASEMRGKESCSAREMSDLTTEELEMAFDFPPGYTHLDDLIDDICRRVLLESYSIPVLKQILQPMYLFRALCFPSDYTRLDDLDEDTRRRILLESYSIPVLKQILQPLTYCFSTEEDI